VKIKFVAGAMVRPAGVTEMETMVAFVTSRVTEAFTEPSVALMVVVPGASPLARPLPAPILATAGLDDVQVTWLVRLRVLPSSKVPIAEKAWLVD